MCRVVPNTQFIIFILQISKIYTKILTFTYPKHLQRNKLFPSLRSFDDNYKLRYTGVCLCPFVTRYAPVHIIIISYINLITSFVLLNAFEKYLRTGGNCPVKGKIGKYTVTHKRKKIIWS